MLSRYYKLLFVKNDDVPKLNQFIKEWMKYHKMNQTKLAELLESNQPQISRICRGKRLTLKFIKRMSIKMDIDYDYLIEMGVKANML